MTNLQRVENLLIGILFLAAAVLFASNEEGFLMIIFVLSVSLLVWGVRYLFYYFHMARHMVDGKTFLFLGIFLLDFGLLSLSLSDEPRWVIVLYLLGFHAFSCVVNLAKGLEEKRYGTPAWKVDMAQGIVSGIVFILCLVNLNSPFFLKCIFCGGLLYASAARIISAFRRTAIVYIQ